MDGFGIHYQSLLEDCVIVGHGITDNGHIDFFDCGGISCQNDEGACSKQNDKCLEND